MPFPLPSRRVMFRSALIFASFFVTAQLSSHFYAANVTAPALIWPASGIALAAFILVGPRYWPAVAVAAFLHQVLVGGTLLAAVLLTLANVGQALLGWQLLRQFRFDPLLARLYDTFALTGVALTVSIIVPTVGIITYALTGAPLPLAPFATWGAWWAAQILSLLVVTPVIVRWLPKLSFTRTKAEWTEAFLAMASLIAIDLALFWSPITNIAGVPLAYLVLAPLFWFALRIGPRGMTLALVVNAALALFGTIHLYTGAALAPRLFQTELYVIILAFIFLLLVSLEEERKEAVKGLKERAERLEDAIDRIRQEDEAKARFIATLAHELRNPLAPLMSSLEVLALESKDREARTSAESMHGHVGTMRRLLDDLLDLSRVSRKKLVLQKEHVDLHAVMNQAVRSAEPLINERKHALHSELPPDAVLFEADPVRLSQIVVNLLNNAAKYTEPGGTITLSASADGGTLTLAVSDTGMGIAPEMLERVFEPFLQIHEERPGQTGLGIGLSLTRDLVALHGGTIEAASEGPGTGSTFTVRLPIARRAPEETRAPEPADHRSRRVLVVDDNAPAAEALRKLLTLRGHVVTTAGDGAEALASAAAVAPEVVLMDIGLPDMSGYEVATRMRENGSTAVLVALTGYGQDADKKRAADAGFAFHLTKPAGLADIEAVFARIP